MKVLKFGGTSLATSESIKQVLEIIREEKSKKDIIVVFSARGDTTDKLIELVNLAVSGKQLLWDKLNQLIEDHNAICHNGALLEPAEKLRKLLKGVTLIGDCPPTTRAEVLAFGEILACKSIVEYFLQQGLKCLYKDSRELISGIGVSGFEIDDADTRKQIREWDKKRDKSAIPLVTGYIASDKNGKTLLLGRNGSDYTAAIIAGALNVSELQIWSHVDGIYTADPGIVPGAKLIKEISYEEANEIAMYGAQILHSKSILPVIAKQIPISLHNTFSPNAEGTHISPGTEIRGIRSVSTKSDLSLITVEGRGLYGVIGIDGRIFSLLHHSGVSVRMISQASSERSIGFVVDQEQGNFAVELLKTEFSVELERKDISTIKNRKNVSILAIVGPSLESFYAVFNALKRNRIEPLLVANAINRKHLSIVIDDQDVKKAIRVIHGQIFDIPGTINIAIFGVGAVGSKLLDQIEAHRRQILEEHQLNLNVYCIANSKKMAFSQKQIVAKKILFNDGSEKNDMDKFLAETENLSLANLIFVDVTADQELTRHYEKLVSHGFDLVAANKKGNVAPYEEYQQLRKSLKRWGKSFCYETNVGAGLPLIETIRNIIRSGDQIYSIQGIFSGSLSYIFNRFSKEDLPFSTILKDAIDNGYTEPDPREDLSGMDVARKLLILAREIGIQAELEDVKVQRLIPDSLAGMKKREFLKNLIKMDEFIEGEAAIVSENTVLRYIAKVDANGDLSVGIKAIPIKSTMAGLEEADNIFEIFTRRYGRLPLVIQGAGAGTGVTAAGVLSDILKIGDRIHGKIRN